MSIAALLRDHCEALLEDFETVARQGMPAARSLSSKQLRNSASDILHAIADDLDTAQSPAQQVRKSTGKLASNAPRLTEHAQHHATTRLEQGFTIDQLMGEFRALRASVMRRIDPQVHTLEDLVRFNESVDQALFEATRCYSAEVEKSREKFLAVLGHDLRNPLGSASMSAEVLLRDEAMSPRSAAAAVRVKKASARMSHLIEDLIDFTRTRLGTKLPMRTTHAEITRVVREIVDEMRTLHPRRDIVLTMDSEQWGHWDVGRIGQLLSNLVGNAIQHGDRQAPVTVAVRAENGSICLSVHNEGRPIPPEAIAQIFEPLTRLATLDDPDSENTPSIGMGLYICREIARAHGGTIEVVSGPGQGTTFVVRLPRQAARDP